MLEQLPPAVQVALVILSGAYGVFWLVIVGVVTVDRVRRAWHRS